MATWVTNFDLDGFDVGVDETEGLIDLVRRTSEAEIACVCKETDGGVRVSLRSVSDLDVGAVAARFGGGGHRYAAGFVAPLPGRPACCDGIEAALREHARSPVRLVASTASSSSTSRRAGRRHDVVAKLRGRTGQRRSVTPAPSTPTPPACCSSVSAGRPGCCATSPRLPKTYKGEVVLGTSTRPSTPPARSPAMRTMPGDARGRRRRPPPASSATSSRCRRWCRR